MNSKQTKTDKAIAALKRCIREDPIKRKKNPRPDESTKAFIDDEYYREQVRRWRYVEQYISHF